MTVYHLQAEIAAIHATAKSDADTDWAGIAALYDQLYQLEPTPIVALNRAIATGLTGWHSGYRDECTDESNAKRKQVMSDRV